MIDIYKNVSDVEFLVWNIQPVEKGRCRTELTASKDDFTELHNNQPKLFGLVKQISQQGRIHITHPVFRFFCLPVSPDAYPHVLLYDLAVFSVFCTSCVIQDTVNTDRRGTKVGNQQGRQRKPTSPTT